MHILTLCRLATVKAVDKLQALTDSDELSELTIVRHRPVPVKTGHVQVRQVSYAPGLPDTVHDFTPLMRFKNHVMMFWTALHAVRREKPDVIYAIFLVPYGLFAWILSRTFRKPCLISLIGTDLNDYTLRWKTGIFFKWMLRHTDLITVVNEDARERLLAASKIKSECVVILPNAVDLRPFAGGENTPKDFDAIYTGRLIDMKEPEKLVETWAQVVKSRPESHLLLLGDGVMRGQLENMVARMGLAENIIFAGWVDDVPTWIHRGRVFLSLSSQEGVPTALIEAMAGGLVPIHTNVGGVPSVLTNGVNGFLVDYPTDVNAVAERILQLLTDDECYRRMQAEALKVHEQYSLSGVTQAWNRILQNPNLRR